MYNVAKHTCVFKSEAVERVRVETWGSPDRTNAESFHVLLQVITANQFSVMYTGETFLLPVLHIPVDSGQDLDLRSCNVHGGYHRLRGLYGRSL